MDPSSIMAVGIIGGLVIFTAWAGMPARGERKAVPETPEAGRPDPAITPGDGGEPPDWRALATPASARPVPVGEVRYALDRRGRIVPVQEYWVEGERACRCGVGEEAHWRIGTASEAAAAIVGGRQTLAERLRVWLTRTRPPVPMPRQARGLPGVHQQVTIRSREGLHLLVSRETAAGRDSYHWLFRPDGTTEGPGGDMGP